MVRQTHIRLARLLTFAFALGLLPLSVKATPLIASIVALESTTPPTTLRGVVRGSVELHHLVGDRDSFQNRCMGYGSVEPDHVLRLPQDLKTLKLQVTSQNRDTTMIVRGNGKVYCADDSPSGKDAGITLSNLKTGNLEVWVGSFEARQRIPYRLTIR